VPSSPLGAGFLTGRIDASTPFDAGDFRSGAPRFMPEARAANVAFVGVLRAFDIGAAEVQLTADDLREIDGAASEITVHGARLA
jgi:aryl-alcohol dehydrogenase-like predicted oxidoreductase